MDTKICTVCKVELPLNRYYKNKLTKNGFGSQCKMCDTNEKRRLGKEKKKYLVDLLGGKCKRCGYNKSIAALDFHHLNDKKFEISIGLRYSMDSLIEESKKCELLCSNCYRELHERIEEQL